MVRVLLTLIASAIDVAPALPISSGDKFKSVKVLLTLIASAFDVVPAALKPLREKIGQCLVDCDFLSNRRSTGISYKIEKQIQIV